MIMKMKNNIKLSVVILSYNTKDVLCRCLEALFKSKGIKNYQVIVVDNGSKDGSIETIQNSKIKNQSASWRIKLKIIQNKKNLGFARGNNSAREYCSGEYVLFLNSDVILPPETIEKTLTYMGKNPDVGALSCRLVLPNGKLDQDARRSFPTPFVALAHFAKLDRLFPESKLFARYWCGYVPEDKIQEVDVIQGAYFLTPKKVLDEVGWFDKDYFLDGEDIDLCWKIKEKGLKIIYYPEVSAIHLKGVSKKKGRSDKRDFAERKKFILEGVRSMEIFYKKRLKNRYPVFLSALVILAIKTVAFFRILRLKVFGN